MRLYTYGHESAMWKNVLVFMRMIQLHAGDRVEFFVAGEKLEDDWSDRQPPEETDGPVSVDVPEGSTRNLDREEAKAKLLDDLVQVKKALINRMDAVNRDLHELQATYQADPQDSALDPRQ